MNEINELAKAIIDMTIADIEATEKAIACINRESERRERKMFCLFDMFVLLALSTLYFI